jgi:hypothetical protein
LVLNGHTVSVEVTRHNVPRQLQAHAEIRKRKWRYAELRFDWVVDMVGSFNVRETHQRVASLLEQVEAAGIGVPSGRYGILRTLKPSLMISRLSREGALVTAHVFASLPGAPILTVYDRRTSGDALRSGVT